MNPIKKLENLYNTFTKCNDYIFASSIDGAKMAVFVESLNFAHQLDLISWITRPDMLADSEFYFTEKKKTDKNTDKARILVCNFRKLMTVTLAIIPVFNQPLEITMKTMPIVDNSRKKLELENLTFFFQYYKSIDFSLQYMFPELEEKLTPLKKLFLAMDKRKYAEIESVISGIYTNFGSICCEAEQL